MPRAQSPAATQVARAARPILAAAEVVAERLQVLEPRRAAVPRSAFEQPCRRADAARCAGAAAGSGTRPRAPWCWRSDSAAPDAAPCGAASGHRPQQLGIAQQREQRRIGGGFVDRAAAAPTRTAAPRIAALCSVRRAARRQAVDAREQQAFDRRRHFHRAGRRTQRQRPSRTACQHAVRDQPAHDFFEIQRIAAGLAHDALVQRALDRRTSAAAPKNAASRASIASSASGASRSTRVRDAAAVERSRVERRAARSAPPATGRSHSQSASVAQAFDRRGVGPLQVLDAPAPAAPARGGARAPCAASCRSGA